MLHLLAISTLTDWNMNYAYSSMHSSNCSVYCFLVGFPNHGEFPLMDVQNSSLEVEQTWVLSSFCGLVATFIRTCH